LLLLFSLFAVLLNCPYPDPPVFACFFPFSSAPRQGEGWPRGNFVAGRSQAITKAEPEIMLFSSSSTGPLPEQVAVVQQTYNNLHTPRTCFLALGAFSMNQHVIILKYHSLRHDVPHIRG